MFITQCNISLKRNYNIFKQNTKINSIIGCTVRLDITPFSGEIKGKLIF